MAWLAVKPLEEVMADDYLDVLIRIQAELIEARRLAAETADARLAKFLLSVADQIEQRAREVDRSE
jgi:hypothetical protein